MRLTVGDARITRVEELRAVMPVELLTEERALIEGVLRPFLSPDPQSVELVFQSWIIEVDGLKVVVDPCNGNGRKRPNVPYFNDLDVPWLERFAATGVRPEEVDVVFCTHLHCDHCGWNTRLVGGRWVPTFPKARYLFVAREYARWSQYIGPRGEFTDYNAYVFEESLKPIVEAGLAELIEAPRRVSPSLEVEAAEGHTLAHAMLRLASRGRHAYFVGDALHHPAEIYRPDLTFGGAEDQAMAVATRRRIYARAHEEDALIFPAHFAEPHYGRVVRLEDGGFGFAPGGAEVTA
jgi:glyoxylase-like metal-dependent hydrolase (beta-lactamase superfamily II)